MKAATSKFVFALIIGAYIVGRIYIFFNPSYTIENNLELNTGYYPGITESTGPVTTADYGAYGDED